MLARVPRRASTSSASTKVRATATSAARDADEPRRLLRARDRRRSASRRSCSPARRRRGCRSSGATTGLAAPAPYLVVDIGGGSTEFVLGTTAPEALRSVDVGCVRVTEQWLALGPADAPRSCRTRCRPCATRSPTSRVRSPRSASAKTLVGLAGTITTFAAVEQGLAGVRPGRASHHFRLTREAAEEVFRTLALESTAQRRHNPGLEPGPGRRDRGRRRRARRDLPGLRVPRAARVGGRHPRRAGPLPGLRWPGARGNPGYPPLGGRGAAESSRWRPTASLRTRPLDVPRGTPAPHRARSGEGGPGPRLRGAVRRGRLVAGHDRHRPRGPPRPPLPSGRAMPRTTRRRPCRVPPSERGSHCRTPT